MNVEAPARADQIIPRLPQSTLFQRDSRESMAGVAFATDLLQARGLKSTDSPASLRLEIDAARLFFAVATAICVTGPMIWLLVRYWLFAP